MNTHRRARRPAIFAAALAGAVFTAGAATAEGPVSAGKPFYVDCNVTSVTEARVSGVGARTNSYSHQKKYLIDPSARTITSMLDFNVKRGTFEKTDFIDDVRQMNDLQIVFCADQQFGCKPFDRRVNASRQFGQIGLYVLNLQTLTLGYSYESHVEGGGQLGSERSQVNGSCRITPA